MVGKKRADPDGWRSEFFPEPTRVSESYKVITVGEIRRATELSLLKWTGYLTANLKKHGLQKSPYRIVPEGLFVPSGRNCHLCVLVDAPSTVITGSCKACPLYLVRGGVECDSATATEKIDPYRAFTAHGRPAPMIRWLRRAEVFVEQIAAGRTEEEARDTAVRSV